MRLINCEHPHTVFNKATGEKMQVPCGHCNVCRNKRSSSWVGRLNQESACWPYTVFFSLTYDNQFVPRLHLNDDYSLSDSWSGLYIDPSYVLSLSAKDRAYVRKRKGLTYPSVVDCQKFIKRLRYNFRQTCKTTILENGKKQFSEDPSLRYFLVSEYGPSGHRIHYHGLLFFSSKRCFEKIDELVAQSWKFGIIDAQPVRSSAAQYVAGYINSIVCLPKVFEHKLLRPFQLYSKCPPLGSLQIVDEKVKEIFFKGITSLRLARGSEYVCVPLFKYLKDRLFPKLRGFDTLDHDARVGLYATLKFFDFDTFKEFKEWYDGFIFDNPIFGKQCEGKKCINLFVKDSAYHYLYSLYDPLFVKDPYHLVKRFWQITNRVRYQALIFGISIRDYVGYIEQFYRNVERVQLRHYFEQQVLESQKYGNVRHWIYSDFNFVHVYINELWERMPFEYVEIVRSFGLDAYKFYHDEDYRRSVNPYKYKEFLDFYKDVMKKVENSHKTKERKEYLRKHPECRIV